MNEAGSTLGAPTRIEPVPSACLPVLAVSDFQLTEHLFQLLCNDLLAV